MAGLQTWRSQGKLPAVWLHTADKTAWAFLHTVKRHGGRIQDVVTFHVEVDAALLKRSSVEGLFYVLEDVQPEYLRAIVEFAVVAASPLGGD
jgi:hypothetical protein